MRLQSSMAALFLLILLHFGLLSWSAHHCCSGISNTTYQHSFYSHIHVMEGSRIETSAAATT
ncbi:hypothetical protein M758_10G089600 [Ceratodon purpureus]|nr:hypothetical protein M758_10G089600 [Ceratodon purpureus]